MKYEVHFGVELPFWIALDDGRYDLRSDGGTHRINLSNHIARLEIGDFFTGGGAVGSQWVHEADAELVRELLQKTHSDQCISRHQAMTVITHVREIDAPDESALLSYYGVKRDEWYEQTLRVFNKFILSYMISAHEAGELGYAGAVDSWDLGGLLVSFWADDPGAVQQRQFGGYYELVRPRTPAPAPVAPAVATTILARLASDEELPLVDVLHVGAASQRQRGSYRSAIVDDITALELEAEQVLVDLVSPILPPGAIRQITRRFFDIQRWTGFMKGPQLKDSPFAADVTKARERRHLVNHRGQTATRTEAEEIHGTVSKAIAWLRAQVKGPSS